MADNLTTVAGVDATLPVAAPIATKQLADLSHAGVSVVIDPADRTKMLKPAADGSLPLSANAATEAAQATLLTSVGTDISAPTAMPAGGAGVRGWLSAIWTKLNGTLAVTGTFWQATQPVSLASQPLPTGAATETTLAAVNTKLGASLPLPTGAATQTTLAALAATDGLLADTTWDGATANPTKQSILRSLWTKLEAIRVAVTDASAVSTTKDVKDTGRTSIAIVADEYQTTAVALTRLDNMKVSKAAAAATTISTGYTVTTGKVFRIQYASLQVSTTAGNTTAVRPTVRLHIKAGGAANTTDPVLCSEVAVSSSTALGAGGVVAFQIPDGFELAAGDGICASVVTPGWVVTTAAPLVTVNIIGFEYTP